MSPDCVEDASQWERVLWKKKSYPDNYVPESFLSSLSRNPNVRPYTYASLLCASYAITQHLAVIFIFLAVFVRLKERRLDPRLLVWLSTSVFIIGHTTWEFLNISVDHASRSINRAKTLKSSILVFLALMALSPVLRTLTAATSSDSIWALSACLFILNVLLADYSPMEGNRHTRERLTSVLSSNAAISASVVLASRMVDDISVFALMLFSIQSFSLFPVLRRRLQTAPAAVQVTFTICLIGLAVLLTAPLSPTIAYLYSVVFCFVTLIAPAILIWAQRFKNVIRGTWDPAIPRVNTMDSMHTVYTAATASSPQRQSF